MPSTFGETPGLERLENRRPLAASPSNLLASAVADVATADSSAVASVSIPATALTPGKKTTEIALVAEPTTGSAIIPEILSATGPDGRPLAIRQVKSITTGVKFVGLVADSQPASITVTLSGEEGSTGGVELDANLPGDANGDGRVTIADLTALVASYHTSAGGAAFHPAADANSNDYVGGGDAALTLRNSPPSSPKVPLYISIHLAPGEQVQHPSGSNSGGITYDKDVTVEGHTIPGSIAFVDSGLGNYRFTGPALATDSEGNFSYNLDLKARFTSTEYLVVDPFGRSKIFAFPILLEKD